MKTKKLSPQTRRLYKRWIFRLNSFHGIHPDNLTNQQVEQFITSLSREYAQATINEAAIAINRYYAEKGVDYNFPTKSLKSAHKLPQALLSRDEAQDIKVALPEFYHLVFDEIYYNLIPPRDAVKKFQSRGWSENHLHMNTLYKQIKAARDEIGMVKMATPTTIHQAGIIHFLQDTNDLREAANKTGLSDKRILYYYKIAKSIWGDAS